MLCLPRLAVGTIDAEAETQSITWGLMELLVARGCQVQHFHARACFSPLNAALPVTGLNSRHLDSWLMTREVCREVFVHGCATSDLAIVEGRFDLDGDDSRPAAGRLTRRQALGSKLDTLCDWLDLPRIVVLDAARLHSCLLPERPLQIDGILLDRVDGPGSFWRLETELEALWDVPVLGALEEMPHLAAAMAGLVQGSNPPRELCRELAAGLQRYTRTEQIMALAARRDLPPVRPGLFQPPVHSRPLTVAVAYDAAFNCYFPDTLDLLELLGARVVDFSPLRDEFLPDADVVYLGCGHPERHAEALTGNHCMLLALRNHIRAGKRVYGEGGGLAYLCQHLETREGRRLPMLGALPAIARPNPSPRPVEAVEVTLRQRNWLGEAGTRLRGYLNSNWLIEPIGPLDGCLAEEARQYDLVGRYQVLGSRMHLNFAAQSEVLSSFFEPHGLPLMGQRLVVG